MFIYLLMIGLVAFGTMVYTLYPNVVAKKNNGTLSIHESRKKCYLHPMFILILAAFMVPYIIRYYVGTDYYAYYLLFEAHGNYSFSQIINLNDFGYYLIEHIDYIVSNGNWYFHTAVLGLIIYFPVLYHYFRFSNSISYAILIYISFMNYFSGYNAIRQTLAVSMMVCAITAFFEKRKIVSLLFVLVAYSFHSSVVIIVVLFLVCLINRNHIIVKIIKGIMLISAIALPNIWSSIINFLDTIGQSKMASDYADANLSGSNGANILRIAVYIVPVLLVYIFGRRIMDYIQSDSRFDVVTLKYMNFVMNSVEIAAIFMVASYRYWVLARMASFFEIFIPVFMSYTFPVLKKEYQFWYKLVSLILFFIYMYMLLKVESNLLPFKTEWGWYFK